MNSSRPSQLSIVVAAWNSPELLSACLSSLEAQVSDLSTEVIVVSNYDCPLQLKQRFPFARFDRECDTAIVPKLRTQGVLRSAGQIVAILEDHCTVGDGWCAEIIRSHELPYSIVGGSVENSSDQRALDWAVYFYDYGRFMLPDTPRVVASLSGANVSYKRQALERVSPLYKDGFYEEVVHDELLRLGYSLYLAPAAVVHHNKEYSLPFALTQAFHHARTYGAKRISGAVPAKRLMYMIGSLILPLMLPLRTSARVVRKGRHLKALARSLPYLILLLAGWSCGEFSGYVLGEGKSAERWR